MLDIVQLFFLLFLLFSYCIVGPMSMYIYIYICNVVVFLEDNKNYGFSLFSLHNYLRSCLMAIKNLQNNTSNKFCKN